jgi:hypothetical protein
MIAKRRTFGGYVVRFIAALIALILAMFVIFAMYGSN